ncbi:MAG: DUF5813 family protein [Halobacteriales archaeon]
MTDELLAAAKRRLSDHGAFEERDGGYVVTTTPFEATVNLGDAGSEVSYRIVMVMPTLDAAVEGEEVAPVVQEGWFETFERRVTHVDGVTRVDPDTPLVSLDVEAEEVRVELAFRTSLPDRGAEDAKALIDFVEGTYVQGIVPGYDYGEPVSELVERAAERSDSEGGPPML